VFARWDGLVAFGWDEAFLDFRWGCGFVGGFGDGGGGEADFVFVWGEQSCLGAAQAFGGEPVVV
jgi:hypothetical protein